MKLLITTVLFTSLAAYSNAVGPLSVVGNKVLINGKSGALKGNSLFWTNKGWGGEKFFNADVVNWLKRDWKANIIRVPMGVEHGGGYLDYPYENKNRLITVVDAAIKADIYVIIDWHSSHAHQHQSKAIAFFVEMAKKYGKYNNVIYELYNEPWSDVTWGQVKSYAIAVIKAIRAIDPDNLIIVGTPYWSTGVDIAANDPITGYKNIAYTLHFYAATGKQELRDKAATALKKNLPLFVTEWGTVRADSNGAVDIYESNKWTSFLKQNQISHCNWAMNDKAESASALKPGANPRGGWSIGDLTDSGKYVRNLLRRSS